MAERKRMEEAMEQVSSLTEREALVSILSALYQAGEEGETLIVPVVEEGEDAEGEPLRVGTQDGTMWLPAFTGEEEYQKGENCTIAPWTYYDLMDKAIEAEEVEGILLNPWGKTFPVSKEMIRMVLQVRGRKN